MGKDSSNDITGQIESTTGITPIQQEGIIGAGGVFHVDDKGVVDLDINQGADLPTIGGILSSDNVKSNR